MEKHSLLDAHTPEAIIKLFSDLNDCTAEMIELIKNTGQNDLRKARQVFLKVNNYEIAEIYELTRAKNRLHRQNSTYAVLSKIRAMCRKQCAFEEIEEMYNTVFCVRARDTYAVIRGMCVDFLADCMIDNEVLWKKEYLKHIVWALEDRSELVRKKALRGVLKIFTKVSKRIKKSDKNIKHMINTTETKRIKITNINPTDTKHINSNDTKSNTYDSTIQRSDITTTAFFEQCSEKILEMTEEESGNIAKVAQEIVYFVFSQLGCINENQVLSILSRDNGTGQWRSEALKKLCPGGVCDIDRLYEIASIAGGRALRGLCRDTDEVAQLMTRISNYLDDGGFDEINEHENKRVCLLEILSEQQLQIDPGIFERLLNQTKDSFKTTAAVLECLLRVSTLREHGGETRRLLKIAEKRVFQWPKLMTLFVKLLHAVEKDFDEEVSEILEQLKTAVLASDEFREEVVLPLVRAYDVSDIVDNTAGSVIKCYAALWLIYAGNFHRVAEIEFTDVDDFLTLTEFLIFFYNHGNIDNGLEANLESEIIPDDKSSCLRFLYQRLYDLLCVNPQFHDEAACLQLYKLISIGLFVDYAHLLFENCSSDAITCFIAGPCSATPLISGFLKAAVFKTQLHRYARPLALKCIKSKISIVLLIKQYVTNTSMLEHILPHFVSALTVNECIFLEGLVENSKFKTVCLRKINTNVVRTKENVTVI